ncbi:MAG: hypothetical protein CMB56_000660 [Methanobacteriota archaeon]|nr:MAG: hypothetical protein CMB56_000660 [Euryarchaeota archaeon]|tara:strand:- start:4462 stop:5496 length:1035 start_codon:yes stop_codon:yes gene_type:complete
MNSLPLVVTVIPTYHECDYIEKCLDSLCKQTYPPKLHQIIVVDGNSSDGTQEIVSEYIKKLDLNHPKIMLLSNPHRYVSQARNIAFENLPKNTEYIFETIGHATYPEDHLEVRIKEFLKLQEIREGKIAAIGTILKPPEDKMSLTSSVIESTLSNPLGSGRGAYAQFSGLKRTRIPPLAIYSVEALSTIDGYDGSLITAQDSDLNMRLIKKGWEIWRSDISCIYVTKRQNITQWLRFGHRNGFWRVKLVKKHPTRMPLGEIAPWFGFLLTSFLFIFKFNFWWVPPAMYLLVIIFAGFIEFGKSKKPIMLIGVPILLIMLHTTFSIGLLHGFLSEGRAPRDRVYD